MQSTHGLVSAKPLRGISLNGDGCAAVDACRPEFQRGQRPSTHLERWRPERPLPEYACLKVEADSLALTIAGEMKRRGPVLDQLTPLGTLKPETGPLATGVTKQPDRPEVEGGRSFDETAGSAPWIGLRATSAASCRRVRKAAGGRSWLAPTRLRGGSGTRRHRQTGTAGGSDSGPSKRSSPSRWWLGALSD